jgi:hypothetical protein
MLSPMCINDPSKQDSMVSVWIPSYHTQKHEYQRSRGVWRRLAIAVEWQRIGSRMIDGSEVGCPTYVKRLFEYLYKSRGAEFVYYLEIYMIISQLVV